MSTIENQFNANEGMTFNNNKCNNGTLNDYSMNYNGKNENLQMEGAERGRAESKTEAKVETKVERKVASKVVLKDEKELAVQRQIELLNELGHNPVAKSSRRTDLVEDDALDSQAPPCHQDNVLSKTTSKDGNKEKNNVELACEAASSCEDNVMSEATSKDGNNEKDLPVAKENNGSSSSSSVCDKLSSFTADSLNGTDITDCKSSDCDIDNHEAYVNSLYSYYMENKDSCSDSYNEIGNSTKAGEKEGETAAQESVVSVIDKMNINDEISDQAATADKAISDMSDEVAATTTEEAGDVNDTGLGMAIAAATTAAAASPEQAVVNDSGVMTRTLTDFGDSKSESQFGSDYSFECFNKTFCGPFTIEESKYNDDKNKNSNYTSESLLATFGGDGFEDGTFGANSASATGFGLNNDNNNNNNNDGTNKTTQWADFWDSDGFMAFMASDMKDNNKDKEEDYDDDDDDDDDFAEPSTKCRRKNHMKTVNDK